MGKVEHVSDIAALDRGDAIKMGEQIGAATVDLEWVQVSHWWASHPIHRRKDVKTQNIFELGAALASMLRHVCWNLEQLPNL